MARANEFENALRTLQSALESDTWQEAAIPQALRRDTMDALAGLRACRDYLEVTTGAQPDAAGRARQAIATQALRYEALLEFAGDALIITDATGSVRFANHAAAELLKAPQDLVLRQPLARFVAPEERPVFRRRIVQLSRYQAPLSWQVRMRRRDGTRFFAEMHASEHRSPAEDDLTLLWRIRELTDEPEPKDREGPSFRAVVDGVRNYALFLLDLEGRIYSWTVGAQQFFGYTQDEIVGQPYSLLFVPEDRASGLYRDELRDAARDGEHSEERWRLCKDGRRIRCANTVAPVHGPGQSLQGFSVVMRDITQQWRTHQALLEREEQLRLVLQATQTVYWDCDLWTGRCRLSPYHSHVLGLPPGTEECRYSALKQHVRAVDRHALEETVRDAINKQSNFEVEFQMLDQKGSARWLNAVGRGDYDPLGRATHLLGFVRDVTERRIANEERIKSRNLVDVGERKGAILLERNRMAREIHDTLAQGFTGIFIQLEAAADALASAPLEVPNHIARARELARNSLAEARRSVHALRALALEGRDLQGALQHLIEQITVGTESRASLTVKGDPFALTEPVEANLLRIGQEALTNALRHSSGSRVVLTLSYRRDGVRLKVADNGIGFNIPEDAEANVSKGGMGLLGIQERAQTIQGRANITSRPGKGTVVDIFVPMRFSSSTSLHWRKK